MGRRGMGNMTFYQWMQTLEPTDECIPFPGHCPEVRGGYGRMTVNKVSGYAHRFSYEMHVGPIPSGMHLDHLCRNPPCINPRHLEPVTPLENHHRGIASEVNSARHAAQTHCKRYGHPLSGDNLRIAPSGQRVCRACRRLMAREAYYTKRGRPIPDEFRRNTKM